jgi:hypothetical protein
MGRQDDLALYAVSRMRGHLERPGGKPVTFLATGFWVLTADRHVLFVTNKHNVDPTLKHGALTAFTLARVELEWRPDAASDGSIASAAFHDVKNVRDAVWTSDKADCAMLVDPEIAVPVSPTRLMFPEQWLGDHLHLARLQLGDQGSFIGYPGLHGKPWFDTGMNAPISRAASVASIPAFQFSNEQVPTADVMLVSGLSFSGSSGSPVSNMPRGIPPGGDISDPNYLPALIIGIMSGHWWEDAGDAPEMFRHSGLSYLTRSTSLRALIEEARAKSWRH